MESKAGERGLRIVETIKDRVAIIGMGCTTFAEHYDKSVADLVIEACFEAFEDAKVDPDDIPAGWIGTVNSGGTGQILTRPIKEFQYKKVTHNENGNATGLDALKCAAYGVASKVYDIVLAVGVEKTKQAGQRGLPNMSVTGSTHWGLYQSMAGANPTIRPMGQYAQLATRYFARYGLSPEDGKRVLAMISVKSHHNGALNPKAYFQRDVTLEEVMNAPILAWPLGIFDSCALTDGCTAAIVVRAEDAKSFRPDPVYIKALEYSTGSEDLIRSDYDFTHIEDSYLAGRKAYEVAGIKAPREEISLAEVDDCLSISELISLEDLQLSPRGKVKEDIEAGFFTLEGKLPVQPDGGMKCFGHPIGASGLRQVYEIYLQLQGRAGPRQLKEPKLGLAHIAGGLLEPAAADSACGIFGI